MRDRYTLFRWFVGRIGRGLTTVFTGRTVLEAEVAKFAVVEQARAGGSEGSSVED